MHFPCLFVLDWVEVANDLLRKCRIKLRLTKLADCDGNVFISLYENILGEKVPGRFRLFHFYKSLGHIQPEYKE